MSMEFNLENPLPTSEEHHHYNSNSIISLFHTESDHMPSSNSISDLTNSILPQTISLISHFSQNFDPFLSYLARNYLHRFLSSHSFPKGKPWILRLVAVSCVSLALKMRETEYFLTDIQDGGLIFDVQTVERMELLILGALKWRMRSITPFSFINFFISLLKFKDPSFVQVLKKRATEIIFKAQFESKLFEFKPSIIAASALLSASHELFPLQFACFRKAISNCSYVNEDNFCRCYNVIQETVMDGYESVFDTLSGCSTPINVLDLHCSSSSSEITNNTTNYPADLEASITTTRLQERGLKRRKIISNFRTDNTSFQLSQVQHC